MSLDQRNQIWEECSLAMIGPIRGDGPEGPQNETTQASLSAKIAELVEGSRILSQMSPLERGQLVQQCLLGVMEHAREWVDASCQAKGIAPSSPCRAEEIMQGPLITVRQLQLIGQTLDSLHRRGRPSLPGTPRVDVDGRLRVPVFPDRGLFDALLFPGFRAMAWMQPGTTPDDVFQPPPWEQTQTEVSLVLGGGNVASIPATDTMTKVFQEGRIVLLKMHPVNSYLGPIFERAFAPLIARGFLRIVYGGADLAAAAIADERITDVHITGSIDTHDTIVWGTPGAERDRRRAMASPVLQKPITSELGNVSPWIVVPGDYSRRQLAFQAENIAASIVNNAGFNCAATRVVITWEKWPVRERFLDLIDHVLATTPERTAYYPGALDRYQSFTGRRLECQNSRTLPWTFLRDFNPQSTSPLFTAESFVCVCVEVALGGNSPSEFLHNAVQFANDRLWGTLSAAITVPPRFRRNLDDRQQLDQCVGRLRYGCVGINHWPGLMYSILSPPWGGFPGATLQDAQSGLGWAHNTCMLRNVEKTVLEGPLTVFPKPLWFPSYADPEPAAWAALDLYAHPSVSGLPRLYYHGVTGQFADRHS